MKRIDIGQTITIIANIGVIAGIAFLALELRQANRIAVVTTELEIRNSFSSLNETFYSDGDVADLLAKATDPRAEFSTVERIRATRVIRRLINTNVALEVAYENGLVPAETFNVMDEDVRNFASEFPGLLPLWRVVIDTYPAQSSRAIVRIWREVLEERGL